MLSSLGNRILWRRANDYINTYRPLVIGIAGSIGKTTAKLAAAQAIGNSRSVYIPPQPYNSPLGVALGILGVDQTPSATGWINLLARSLIREVNEAEADTLILELGANRPGDMDFLASRLPVKIGIVTNVGTVHTDIYGSKEAVAHEYNSLLAVLPPDGTAILNADDALVAPMAAHTRAKVVTFGRTATANIRVTRLERLPHHGFACEVVIDGKPYELHLRRVIGRHQISAILAALALAHVLKLDVKAAAQRLQNFTPPQGRLTLQAGKNGSRLIDDTYDASPESMLSSLETLRALPGDRKIAILGDINDLGGQSHSAHKRIGKYAGEVARIVVGVGNYMRLANVEAITVGADVHHFEKAEDVSKWLADYLQPGDLVLVTGSRGMRMEKVVEHLSA